MRGHIFEGVSLMNAPHWTTQLELALSDPRGLRVLDTRSLYRLAQDARPGISKASIERWIREAITAQRIQRVVRGLYLNRFISPPAQVAEAAVWLRPGAVVSLQTVLGDAGVWNNFTDAVTAVVPLSPRYSTPSLGRVETSTGSFLFRGMPARLLDAGREKDRLSPEFAYRRATPEAALLHWLYLSRSPRSRMSPPPMELELDELDRRRLRRLAKAMQLEAPLNDWLDRKYSHDAAPSIMEQTWQDESVRKRSSASRTQAAPRTRLSHRRRS